MELLGLALLCIGCRLVASDRHTVFWNSSNTRFLWDDFTVEVRLNDYLDIICPHYEEGESSARSVERYILYLVDLEEYETCKPRSKEQVRWECNKPFALHGPEKFSEKFQRFTPFTLGKEFKEGHSYYYISKPIHHHGDYCLKLRVSVGSRATQPPPPHARTYKTRIQSDEPLEGLPGILQSVGRNSALRTAPLSWSIALIPLLLLPAVL
uniref:Ephrin-A1 n=1 Tax=Geotrypetes seraphini TaxID=260995 RepID=A0A6P8P6P1_GEOSA|nr:ephrin-A1 [Geotrypetes seraphini]